MRLKDIFNIDNISSFIEGHAKYFYDNLLGMQKHQKEQVAYRLLICQSDCVPQKSCKYCGCPPEKKVFVYKSCNNGERFPDMMSKEKWEQFKKDNNIDEHNLHIEKKDSSGSTE